MKSDEVVKVVRVLGGLFPGQVTQEQAKFLGTELAPFTFEAANRAVREHRRGREFVNIPQLLEGCRAAERKDSEVRENAGREGSWCDVQRRLRPQLAGVVGQAGPNGERAAGQVAADVEVILRVHRQWLHGSSGNESYARQFRSSCRAQLIVAGVPKDEIDRWAETIFWATADFRQVLDDVRSQPFTPAREPEAVGSSAA